MTATSLRIALALLIAVSSSTAPAHADTALRLDLEGLVERAGLVVEARVLAARGTRHANGMICTEYTLAVSRTFLGEPTGVRTITVPGGVLPDGSGMLLPGLPRLRAGEEVVLFLTEPGSTGLRVPVGAAQGAYFASIDDRGVRRVGPRLAGLTRIAEHGDDDGSEQRTDYASFAERVERAVAAKRERMLRAPSATGAPGAPAHGERR